MMTRHAQRPSRSMNDSGLRYPVILVILLLLIAAIPLDKPKEGETRAETLVGYVMSDSQQENSLQWLDNATAELREMPPVHQLLLLTTAIILLINAAVILSYIINSIAAIAGIGFSLAVLLPFLLMAGVAVLFGWRAPRTHLHQHMKDHAEFGPFVSRLSTRMWKKRFARAAREHGWAREY